MKFNGILKHFCVISSDVAVVILAILPRYLPPLLLHFHLLRLLQFTRTVSLHAQTFLDELENVSLFSFGLFWALGGGVDLLVLGDEVQILQCLPLHGLIEDLNISVEVQCLMSPLEVHFGRRQQWVQGYAER